MRTRIVLVTAGICLLAFGAAVGGQQPATEPVPEFEVATVKINKTGDNQMRLGGAGGRIDVINMQLRGVIQTAYRVPANQLVNVPGWVNSTRVDITAKADPKYSMQQLQTMLQPLLVERFKFKFHRETREMDVYALVLANKDGRLGPKLEKSAVDCADLGNAPRSSLVAPKPGETPTCGTIPAGPGHIVLKGFNMDAFTKILSLATRGRQVIDQTGLPGGYNIDLQYTPEALSAAALAARSGAPPPAAALVDPNGPDLFSAVQEQLGLKLESKKVALDMMVVDNIEPPVED
jgi:uncharacterized protein (TIGR03435 family)